MPPRSCIAFIGLLMFIQTTVEGSVSISASKTGVQLGDQITFTATTDAADPVVNVIFSYEGTAQTDGVSISPGPTNAYQITKAMDWMTQADLTVTATFEFQSIPDQSATVVVDVVDVVLAVPTQLTRGNLVSLVAQTAPAGIPVSSWMWTYDTPLLVRQFTDTSNSDDVSAWQGKIVIGGTLTSEATVMGVRVVKNLELEINDRGGNNWNTPITCVEDNEPLWGAPPFGFNEPLGQIRDRYTNVSHIIVPQSSTGDWSDGVVVAQILTGPNAGLWYVVSESLVIDQETVVNQYIKSGGPPPVPGADTFFEFNNAGCINADMADFVTAIKHHEYRGTPPVPLSLEGHFGRMEEHLRHGPGDPGIAVEGLVDTTKEGLLAKVNDAVGFIEFAIDGFASHGQWNQSGPNWGGEGSLGSGSHTRYDVDADQYYSGCTFGPDNF